MSDGGIVKDNLVDLIAKIGEKITIRDLILIIKKVLTFSTFIP